MKNLIFIFLYLCIGVSTSAQMHVSVALHGAGTEQIEKVFVKAQGGADASALQREEGKQLFQSDVTASPNGFYTLYAASTKMQLVAPFYLGKPEKNLRLTLSLKDNCPQLGLQDADNRALAAFNALTYDKGRKFWMEGRQMSDAQILDLLRGYASAADSLGNQLHCTAPVKEYLTLWAYTVAANSYESIPQATGKSLSTLAFKKSELLKSPQTVLDNPLAVCFAEASYVALQDIPQGTMDEKLDYVQQNYKDASMRTKLTDALMSSYIRDYNISTGYEKGLAELETLTAKYKLDSRYLNEYRIKKSAVKGTPFPEGIVLTDTDGKTVDFSRFKGSYVYVDLWASWCGPCCKEVPYLQKLEKEVSAVRSDVAFVSISLDKNVTAWKNKMRDLQMHGNQLLNQDNKVAEQLNVKGIPFFLIYDKEGKLYQYNAPRPSDPMLKELLLGLGK